MQNFPGMPNEDLSLGSGHLPLGTAFKQRYPKRAFQILHGTAEGGLPYQ